MKHIAGPLFVALFIVNGWGEEWLFESGMSRANCNALASELQLELKDGDRAECRIENSIAAPYSIYYPVRRSAPISPPAPPRKKLDAFPGFDFK